MVCVLPVSAHRKPGLRDSNETWLRGFLAINPNHPDMEKPAEEKDTPSSFSKLLVRLYMRPRTLRD